MNQFTQIPSRSIHSTTLLIILVLTVLCGQPVWAADSWVQRGPEGGDVRAIALDPSTPGILFALTGRDVYKSTDAGNSWVATSSGLTNFGGLSLAIDPTTPTTIYTGGFGGVFKSTDGGSTWNQLNSGLTNTTVNTLVIDPAFPTTLYAGTDGGGVFKSIDGGENWSLTSTGITNLTINILAIDPTTPTTLYAGSDNGVFKSTDAGVNWSEINTGLMTLSIRALVVAPTTPTTLYAGTSTGGGGGVHKSTDGGNTWTGPFLSQTLLTLVIDPATPTTVYGGSGSGIFKSTDGGNTWLPTNNGFLNVGLDGNNRVAAIAIDPFAPATLYASTRGGGLFKSTDSAATWRKASAGMFAMWIPAVAVDPLNPDTLYAAVNGGGAFKSIDGGLSWTEMNTGLTSTTFTHLAIDPITPSTVYLGSSGGSLFKSTDGGNSWNALTGLPGGSKNGIAIDPTNPSTIYTTTFDGVYKSTDGGASWNPVNTGLATSLRALVVDPVTPTTLYAGSNSGLFKSTDGGGSWNPSGAGLPTTSFIALAVDPVTPTIVYVGTGNRGVYKSTDGGATWLSTGALPSGRVSAGGVVIDPTRSLTLYAATAGGVAKSTNGGISWITNLNVDSRSIAIDPLNPSTVYAGTSVNSLFEYVPGAAPPRPTAVSPTSVVAGNPVTITGTGFSGGNLMVTFDGVPGVNVQLVDDTTIIATVPLTVSLSVDIFVITDAGFGGLLGELTVFAPPAPDLPPVVTPPPPITLEAQMTAYNIADLDPLGQATATDNEGIILGPITVITGVLTVGVHQILWRAVDTALQVGEAFQEVTVVDTTRPELTIPPNVFWNTQTVPVPLGTLPLGEATATDNAATGLVPTHNAPAEFFGGQTSIQWSVSDGNGHTVVKTQIVQVNLIGPLDIQCMHTPLWPQPGETVTIVAQAVDPTDKVDFSVDPTTPEGDTFLLGPKTVNEVSIWYEDTTAPVQTLQNDDTVSFVTPVLSQGSFTYGCRAAQSIDSAFSGWRQVAVGSPGDDLPIPVLTTRPKSQGIDIVFIADADSYTGPDDPAFLVDISNVIGFSYYHYPIFLQHQSQINFWIARNTGTADRVLKDDGIGTKCVITPPDDWTDNYAFADTGALIHTDIFRDCATGGIFSSEPVGIGQLTVRHEMGHSPFGLADEYCCDGGYWEAMAAPVLPNMYESLQSCTDDAPSFGKSGDDCFTLEEKCIENALCGASALAKLPDTVYWLLEPPLSDISAGIINDLMHDRGEPRPADRRKIEWKFGQCALSNC